ncbi:MAG: hypothetical protein J6S67_08125 [Methanobrevibacter sp.]|nr:hypothetical protein [Methanobrevibacter sp.]
MLIYDNHGGYTTNKDYRKLKALFTLNKLFGLNRNEITPTEIDRDLLLDLNNLEMIYCDTDSIKTKGDIKFNANL